MARANYVKAAAKDYPEHGIKKGEPYYWWKFRHGRKMMSKTRPRDSQLTQSAYKSQAFSIIERVSDLVADPTLKDNVEEIISDLESLADEQEDNRNNMPDSLQDSDSGQLLETRAEACREAASALEQVDLSDFEGKTEDEYWQEKLEEVQNEFNLDVE